jgi:predicted amino acid-binding ACT domain protein
MATIAELRKGLADTTMPADVAETLLHGASSLWLSSDSGAQLAGDLALCHPPLKRNEVRARSVGGDDTWRLTVVAHDRTGLVADAAAILSGRDFGITGASVSTWDEFNLALIALTIDGAAPDEETLDEIGAALRAANDGARPMVPFEPIGRAYVRRSGSANGDAMISVVAPDQRGLLATICRWLGDAGVNIEAAWITGEDEANDVFVVDGDVDVHELEKLLTSDDQTVADVVGDMFADARRAGEALVRGAADVLGRLLGRK